MSEFRVCSRREAMRWTDADRVVIAFDKPVDMITARVDPGGRSTVGDLLTPSGPSEREAIEGHPEWLNYLFASMGPAEVARF